MCDFVDLPYEPRMLEEFGREAERNVGRGETWKDDVGRGVLLDRHGNWRERLTPAQAWMVARATAPQRRALGYPDLRAPSVWSLSRGLAAELHVRFREARGSTGMVGAARYAGSALKTVAAA
jgi:hypothetical protein